ncbi:MAG TPA: VWA domain-containing protein [Blastocatellia bacterium]|jgi:Ca-activated chloride channel family protein
MKLAAFRFSFVAALFAVSGFLVVGIAANSFANQQRPDKPKLQKSQQPKQEEPQQQEDTVILHTDLVLLDVTVVDPSNKPVMDLRKEEFGVTEDKVPQKIEFFSREQVPVSLVFAIDTSGSMRPKIDTVVKASTNLVKESRAGDEMAVIEFKDQPELLEEFTSDVNDVIDTLNGLVASRQTAMLDALYLAADYASKEGKNRRKAVLLVTDGLDNDSYYKFNEVVNHLREIDVQIYLIGFISDLERDSGLFKKSAKDKAEGLLNKLAEETGGKAFFPKELSEVHAIAQQISTDLRTQYAIGYYPTNNKKDGTFRAVRVQVNSGSRRMIARTRNGYTAPREHESRSNTRP